ncbi:MAG: sensor histidine kinase [Bacteroidota bacterium]
MKKSRYIAVLFILWMIPLLLLSQGRRDEANALFDSIAQKENSKEKVQCYIELSQIFRYIDKDSSLLFADNAYYLSTDLGYEEGMADALYKKCLTLDSKGDEIFALDACLESLAIAESIQDSFRMAKAYYHIATLKDNRGEMEQAIMYLHKSLHIFRSMKDTSAMVAVYNGLANYYKDISLLDSAAFYYHKAIFYADAIEWTGPLGRILGNLAGIYDLLLDYENARKYFLMSLEYCIVHNDINDLGYCYSRLGALAADMDDAPLAILYYDSAYFAFEVAGDMSGCHQVQVNRSILLEEQGNYQQALKLLHEALSFYREQDYKDGILAVWRILAGIYAKTDMPGKAIAYHDSCEKLAIQTNNPRRLKGIYDEMYLFYYDLGDHEKALSAYLKYDNLEDSIFNLEKTELINDLLIKYEKEKDQLKIITLENENLQKSRERNLLLFVLSSIIVLVVLLGLFLIYKNRKNRIIAEQKIRQLEEEKKHMAARFLVEGEERERKRVAMELHDNLGVLLSATKMQFSEIHDKDPANKELIEKATKYLEQASTDVRKISHNLMPGLLTKLGLFEALAELFENLGESDKMEAFFEVVGPKDRLPENTEIMLYRVIQELINNTLKHAEADNIDMTMIVQPDEMNISYSDNGKGFKVEEVLKKKTMGMQNIQSRVKFMDGTVSIDSNGHGAVYRICIPLQPGSCEPAE